TDSPVTRCLQTVRERHQLVPAIPFDDRAEQTNGLQPAVVRADLKCATLVDPLATFGNGIAGALVARYAERPPAVIAQQAVSPFQTVLFQQQPADGRWLRVGWPDVDRRREVQVRELGLIERQRRQRCHTAV